MTCPPPSDLRDAIECRSPVSRRREIVDHLAACPSCFRDWRSARGLGATTPSLLRTLREFLGRLFVPWRWGRWA